MGWTRQSFALAIAIQNLSWGVIGIFVGLGLVLIAIIAVAAFKFMRKGF